MRPEKLWKHSRGRIWGNAEDLVEDSFDQWVRWVFGLWKTPLPSHWQQLVRKPKSRFSCQSFMSCKQFLNFSFCSFITGQRLVNFHQLALFQLQLLVDQFGWAFPWTTKSSWRNTTKGWLQHKELKFWMKRRTNSIYFSQLPNHSIYFDKEYHENQSQVNLELSTEEKNSSSKWKFSTSTILTKVPPVCADDVGVHAEHLQPARHLRLLLHAGLEPLAQRHLAIFLW